ncbi:MAG: hypothetical protein HY819_22920 [Acidobacteria bacterium]|nr:hypothetical protein [Acidobacteriota bacterium]
MKRALISILLVVFMIIVFPSATLAQIISGHGLIPQPEMSKPNVGEIIKEPVFNTNLVRITNTSLGNKEGAFPNSAKRQAWNVDESLMLINTGEGKTLLYDGQTYKFKKALNSVSGEDIFWHPTDPFTVIYNPLNTLYSYNVITDEVRLIHSFSEYSFASSRGGNLSNDGRYYAFIGEFPLLQVDSSKSIAQKVKYEKLVLFDIWTDQVISEKVVITRFNDVNWISMSPDGYYIVVNYKSERDDFLNSMDIYDKGFNLIWQQFLGKGDSSDLAIDANGDEVMIVDRYDNQTDSRFIEKYRLFDGYSTILLEHSKDFYTNISTRNLTRFGWCLVSTYDSESRLTDSLENWLPFEDEIFLLKMDGSQDVERLAHHRSRRFSPTTPSLVSSIAFAEPQAVLSRNANRVLFASNWRENIANAASIDAYVIDLRGIPLRDFRLTLNPETISLKKGQSAEIEIDINRIGKFTDFVDLDLTISPNPEYFRVFFTTPINGTGKTKAWIIATNAVETGRYLIQVIGKTQDKMHFAGALVTINKTQQEFNLRIHPSSMVIKRGDSAKVMVGIERLGDFSDDVTVWVVDTKGLKIKVSPPNVSTSAAMVDFNLKTRVKTPLGRHRIIFAATTDNGLMHSAEMFLTVVQ